ncbi:MAG: WG repeat-containing protein [Peptococcaceae bacterium]|nr:WG repeat-containing protein [Peptococcaceae bacterium]
MFFQQISNCPVFWQSTVIVNDHTIRKHLTRLIDQQDNAYPIYDFGGEGRVVSGGFLWNKKYAIANKDGILTDFIYDGCDMYYSSFFTAHDTDSIAMAINGNWGFVGSDGKFIIEPVFEDAISIDAERAFVKQNGKWGIIRKNA